MSVEVASAKRSRMLKTLWTLAILFGMFPGTEIADATGSAHISAIRRQILLGDSDSGIVMEQERRWDPEAEAWVLRSELEHKGRRVASLEEFPLVTWTSLMDESPDDFGYERLSYKNDVWYGSTYWTGPDWTRVGADWHHPGEQTPSVRCFRAPKAGRVTILGRAFKADTNQGGGDGVRLAILHNRDTIWEAEINGDDQVGVEPNCTLDVQEGDRVRFRVHKRGEIAFDTTRWDPIITYEDKERFQASVGFSTAHQGDAGWYYEMDRGEARDQAWPRLRGFGPIADLWEEEMSPGRSIEIRPERLQVLLIENPVDQLGHVLAWVSDLPWRATSCLNEEGMLSLGLSVGPVRLSPGEKMSLPVVIHMPVRGQSLQGLVRLSALLSCNALARETRPLASSFRKAGNEARQRVGLSADQDFDIALWGMVQAEWFREDKISDEAASWSEAALHHRGMAEQLLSELKASGPSENWDGKASQIERLRQTEVAGPLSADESRLLYLDVRTLKREMVLEHSLLKAPSLLFCKRVPSSYSHLVMQYFGWRARPGGGLFILDRPGRSLKARDILNGQLEEGNVLEPRLSYDAQRVVFSYVKPMSPEPDPATLNNEEDVGFYHIYEVRVDGTGLRQLTAGPYEDLMPTYLPDGGIAFTSTRRKGYARCFGAQFSPRWHVYGLHRMDPDGGQLRAISFHDTNEWFPMVSNDGLIVYSRWDYIDRDAVTHQNLWAARPDGTCARAIWGNATPSPHCAFQAHAIPGSGKIVFTASAHHSVTAGAIAVVDPAIARDGPEALQRITPEVPFPEAETRDIPCYYESPWPLSEETFLVAYSPFPLVWEPGANAPNALGIALVDAHGNRELIYRDPQISSTSPVPLVQRTPPPILQTQIPDPEALTGEFFLMDVTRGLGPIQRGAIASLRIIQIFPKTTPVGGAPPIGLAGEENARAVLGTVSVSQDGSARFRAPAGKPLLFQALDEEGFAVQTMRSVTYLQPGERLSCVGCHEHPMSAPPVTSVSKGPAQDIRRGPGEGEPFSFVRAVQPVLDKHCVRCHSGPNPGKGLDLSGIPDRQFTRSYWALMGDADFAGLGTNVENASKALVPRFGMRNQVQITPPGGLFGSKGSRLIRMIKGGHHEAHLEREEVQALATWIDCNAVFYGSYAPLDQANELAGNSSPMPEIQ